MEVHGFRPRLNCRICGREIRRRWRHQRCKVAAFDIGPAQDRVGCGVLQQPANQIGDTQRRIAHRHIHSHRHTCGGHRIAQRLGHAVDHLRFPALRRKVKAPRPDQRQRLVAQIVGGDGRVQAIGVFQQALRNALVQRIRIRLAAEHRQRPIALRRPGVLLIPVSALHQPHADAAAMVLCSADQRLNIVHRFRQVGLKCDGSLPAGRPSAQHVEEQTQDQGLQRVMLHIHRQRGAARCGGGDDGSEAGEDTTARAGGIKWVEAGGQRREFERELRRVLSSPRQCAQQIQISALVRIGLRLRQHQLTHDVHRCQRRDPRQISDDRGEAGIGFISEEVVRQPLRLPTHPPSQRRPGGHAQQPAGQAGNGGFGKIGAQMRRHLA